MSERKRGIRETHGSHGGSDTVEGVERVVRVTDNSPCA